MNVWQSVLYLYIQTCIYYLCVFLLPDVNYLNIFICIQNDDFFLTLPNTFEIIFLILLFILYIKELYLYLKKKKIREKYLQQTALRLKMSSLF